MRALLCLLTGLLATIPALAQESGDVWTLQRCVQYAREHNISIRQSELNERLARLTEKQSRLARLPNLNTNLTYGRSYGRSIDPTSNQFVNADYDFLGVSGSADVLLFGWFQRRHIIAREGLNARAAAAELDQLQDDVSLNVATGYLRALLAQEQIRVNERQVSLSGAQLGQTRSFAEAGRVPELNVAQLESQVATDSANLITAIADYNAAILDLKALLNLDFETPMIIQAPDVPIAEQLSLASMDPETIYAEAARHFGAIRSSELRLGAARESYAAAKGARYPQLGLSAQFGSNWASTYRELSGYTIGPVDQPSGYFTNPSGERVVVYTPTVVPILTNTPLDRQLNNNLRYTVAANLSIPIFNGWQAQYGVRQARINVSAQELNREQAVVNLKQNVYKAYNDARNSVQKYEAARRASMAAERALDFASKRYDLGLTNTVEYLTTQNNQYQAAAALASAKYDLIFRLKVIDYYLGKALKL